MRFHRSRFWDFFQNIFGVFAIVAALVMLLFIVYALADEVFNGKGSVVIVL